MKYAIIALALIAAVFSGGCRREDVREMTVDIPVLKEADKGKITSILAKYQGVDSTSFVWDMKEGSLTLKYDSMKIAQANIRYAIDEAGIKVKFPVKTDSRAGH